MPRGKRRTIRQRTHRRITAATLVAARPLYSGRGRGSRQPATLPRPSVPASGRTSAIRGHGSRRPANSPPTPAVGPTEQSPDQPDREYIHSIIRAEIQPALATAIPQLTPPVSQALPAHSASAPVTVPTPASAQQSG